MSLLVILWSAALSFVALVNVCMWIVAASGLSGGRSHLANHELSVQRLQLLLSAGYVFGCAFRSIVPVFDVPRVALVNSLVSTAAVGRSVATIAELCFIAQWALLLRETSRVTGSGVAHLAARLVIPMIVVAEGCSWYSVLTTSNLGHVFEESLWSMATALIVAGLLADVQRWEGRWRRSCFWLATAGVGYFLYLTLVDVPMYWSRWVADELNGKIYLSFGQGLDNAAGPHVATYAWNVWKSEMLWMAAYFSVAVWISIWLVHAPVPSTCPAVERVRRLPMGAFGLGALSSRR